MIGYVLNLIVIVAGTLALLAVLAQLARDEFVNRRNLERASTCRACGAGFTVDRPWNFIACAGDWIVYFHRECSPGRCILCHDRREMVWLFIWCLWPPHLYAFSKVLDGPHYFGVIWAAAAIAWISSLLLIFRYLINIKI